MQNNWLEIARRKWNNCPIQNAGDCSGRYAVQVIGENSGRTLRVILCESEEQQQSVALGYDRCNKVDLMPPSTACRTIPDAYDPEEARRERRERRG